MPLITLTFHFKVKYWNRQCFKSSNATISLTVTDKVQVTIINEWEVIYRLWMAYLHMTVAHSKCEGQGLAHFDNDYLGNCMWYLYQSCAWMSRVDPWVARSGQTISVRVGSPLMQMFWTFGSNLAIYGGRVRSKYFY